ncbi:sigma-70 family RNA polymerase sigma factor [Streptomyces sp. B-S-A6]|uniref:Sigma-70 family RNA polymerase sigma factor n=1 Tax=Streptomyces cavernicola TaxID=3043613 RepID=A0ABT6SC18_9ACTN|nr:sigma-70 family RNA polymerase sigma factor [Streptomyces sp. B-S-A6]MDI3405737.1 sigma-70 family RNA polymerase sigma factor [Streptomyces sp. B-S-A6]
MTHQNPGAALPRHPTESLDHEEFLRNLYDCHGSALLQFAARRLEGDWHRAEDVLQELAIRAWRHADEFGEAAESMRPWLFTVLRNLVIDGHRARQARPPETGDPELAHLPVSDGVDRVLTAHVVTEALRDLRPPQREVLLHMHYMGRSVNQTAAVLGVPPGTVKSRTYYAARALRRALTDRGVEVWEAGEAERDAA